MHDIVSFTPLPTFQVPPHPSGDIVCQAVSESVSNVICGLLCQRNRDVSDPSAAASDDKLMVTDNTSSNNLRLTHGHLLSVATVHTCIVSDRFVTTD